MTLGGLNTSLSMKLGSPLGHCPGNDIISEEERVIIPNSLEITAAKIHRSALGPQYFALCAHRQRHTMKIKKGHVDTCHTVRSHRLVVMLGPLLHWHTLQRDKIPYITTRT